MARVPTFQNVDCEIGGRPPFVEVDFEIGKRPALSFGEIVLLG